MDWKLQALWVGVGGATGAVARFATYIYVHRWLGANFPWGTLTVNALGSFALGLATAWIVAEPGAPGVVRPMLAVGFLGAFTTFSTFSVDAVVLLEEGRTLPAGLYVLANVGLCLGLAWLGLLVFRHLTIS